jgi:hypothetical protein
MSDLLSIRNALPYVTKPNGDRKGDCATSKARPDISGSLRWRTDSVKHAENPFLSKYVEIDSTLCKNLCDGKEAQALPFLSDGKDATSGAHAFVGTDQNKKEYRYGA